MEGCEKSLQIDVFSSTLVGATSSAFKIMTMESELKCDIQTNLVSQEMLNSRSTDKNPHFFWSSIYASFQS